MSTVKAINLQHPNSSNINMVLGADGSVSGGFPAGGRNRIINGGFDVWQRGTSFTNPIDVYTADRWKTLRLNSTAHTVSQQSGGPTGFRYFLRDQRPASNTATDSIFLGYSWETSDAVQLQGQTVTLSFYARKGANFSDAGSALTLFLLNGTGTDQGPFTGHTGEGSNILTPGTATLTTSWQRFVFTGTFSPNATSARLNIAWSPTGTAAANDYFDITGVQLERGSSPTPFEFKSYAQELRECQRYFFSMSRPPLRGTFSSSTAYSRAAMSLPVPMRIAPTVSSSGTFDLWDGNATMTATSFTVQYTTTTSIEIDGVLATGTSASTRPCIFYNGGNTGVISASAEL
jgi:hypothetical protein